MSKNVKAKGRLPEPSSPEEWREVVNLTYAMLVLDLALSRGFIKGPRANKNRCLDLLRRGRSKGYLPQESEAAAALFDMVGHDHRCMRVVITLLMEEDGVINY
jgi:hypothetical protein